MKNVINIVCDYSSAYGGNFIPSIFKLASSLNKTNQVIVSFPTKAENRYWAGFLKKQGIKLFFFDNTSNSKIIKSVKQINKDNKVNIIYTHFISTPIAKLIAGLLAKNKLIIHVHSDFSCGNNKHTFKDRVKFIIFNKLIRRDAKFIYVSSLMKDSEGNKNSYYVQNALCVDRIISQKDKAVLTKNKINILAFAWSPEVKGVDITCKAFLDVNKDLKDKAVLNIVVNENEGNKCIAYIKERLGVDVQAVNNIVFLEPQEDIFSLLEQVDIFISSSRSEGFSYSILESLYFGLSIFSSMISGTAWSKEYGVTFFNLNNSIELTMLIEDYIVKGHSQKSINYKIAKQFSVDTWIEKISEILLDKVQTDGNHA